MIMKKLTIEHLAPYLPYKLEFWSNNLGRKRKMKEGNIESIVENNHSMKPILHPLSDLVEGIIHDGETFIPKQYLEEKFRRKMDISEGVINGSVVYLNTDDWEQWQDLYWIFQKLFEWHFDIFELIEQGLAIDINTLEE